MWQSNCPGNNAGGAPTVINGYQNSGTVTQYLSKDMSSAHAFANTFFENQNLFTPIIAMTAFSGSSMTNLTANNWSATGALRGTFKTVLDAMVAFYGQDIDLIKCIGGEADAQFIDDATITKAQSKAAYQSFIDWVTLNFPNAKIQLTIPGKLTSGDTTGFQQQRELTYELEAENANCFLGYEGAVNFANYDPIHWSQAEQNVLGAAEALLYIQELGL